MIHSAAEGVDRVLELRTEHLGPDDVLVVARVRTSGESADETRRMLSAAERAVRREVPEATYIHLDPTER